MYVIECMTYTKKKIKMFDVIFHFYKLKFFHKHNLKCILFIKFTLNNIQIYAALSVIGEPDR